MILSVLVCSVVIHSGLLQVLDTWVGVNLCYLCSVGDILRAAVLHTRKKRKKKKEKIQENNVFIFKDVRFFK